VKHFSTTSSFKKVFFLFFFWIPLLDAVQKLTAKSNPTADLRSGPELRACAGFERSQTVGKMYSHQVKSDKVALSVASVLH